MGRFKITQRAIFGGCAGGRRVIGAGNELQVLCHRWSLPCDKLNTPVAVIQTLGHGVCVWGGLNETDGPACSVAQFGDRLYDLGERVHN
jgi:hypothetical protein